MSVEHPVRLVFKEGKLYTENPCKESWPLFGRDKSNWMFHASTDCSDCQWHIWAHLQDIGTCVLSGSKNFDIACYQAHDSGQHCSTRRVTQAFYKSPCEPTKWHKEQTCCTDVPREAGLQGCGSSQASVLPGLGWEIPGKFRGGIWGEWDFGRTGTSAGYNVIWRDIRVWL